MSEHVNLQSAALNTKHACYTQTQRHLPEVSTGLFTDNGPLNAEMAACQEENIKSFRSVSHSMHENTKNRSKQ